MNMLLVLLLLYFTTCFALVRKMKENGVLLLGSGVYKYCLPITKLTLKNVRKPTTMFWKPDNILPGQGVLYNDVSAISNFNCDYLCCDLNLEIDSPLYERFLLLTQGPGTFIIKRNGHEISQLRMTMQHKDAPAYSTQSTRISAIRPYNTETVLDWCTGSEIQNSICNSVFMQSRFQGGCGNCWAQATVAILEFTAARYSRLILSPDWSLSVEDVSIRFQSPSHYACQGYMAHKAINKAFAYGVFMIDADPSYRSDDAYSKEDKEKMYSFRRNSSEVIKDYPKIKTDYIDAKRMFFRGFCTYALRPLLRKENDHVNAELVDDIAIKIAEYGPAIVSLDASFIRTLDFTKQADFEANPNLVYGTTSFEKSTCKSKLGNSNHAAALVGYGVTPNGTPYWIVRHAHYVRWFRIIRDATNMCGVLSEVIFVVPCDKPAINVVVPDARLDSAFGTGIWVGNSMKDRTVKRVNIMSLDGENPFEGVIGAAGEFN